MVAFALSVAYAGAARGQTVDELIRDLSGADAARRADAVKRLGDAGAAAAPRVAQLVESADTEEARRAALEALSRNSMAYAYSYVFWDALPPDDPDDPDDREERRLVWDCLIRLGDTFIAVGEFGAASDHYCDLLESAAGARERAMAIRGLGRSSRRRAAEEVFSALAGDDPLVRAAAVAAIADLRWGQARPHLEKALGSAPPARLVDLLDALSRRVEPGAATMVGRLLDHEDPTVRAAAGNARARHAGFVTDWWVVGPLPAREVEEVDASVAKMAPRARNAVELSGRTFEWRRLVASGSHGAVDLTGELELNDSTVYARAEIVAATARAVRLSADTEGGGAPRACWLNGRPVAVAVTEKGAAPAAAELLAGVNVLVARIDGGARRFRLRVTDERGAPVIAAPPMGGEE